MSVYVKEETNPPASIYLLNEPLDPSKMRAPQQIGLLWKQIQKVMGEDGPDTMRSLLGKLGVTETDRQAHEALIPMIQSAFSPRVEIAPSEDPEDTGVYYLSVNRKKFAVFKVGEKRARMELLVRHIAHRIGLEKHAIPGVFCSIANPAFPKAETIAELWNGNQKVFGKGDAYAELVRNDNFGVDQPYTLTGILEPYVPTGKKISVEGFARMTALALCIGLRDGKMSGIGGDEGATFFDTEECMPPRLEPLVSPNKSVAATHLPYLEDPLAVEQIPLDVIAKLAKLVDEEILSLGDLSEQQVVFADLASESLEVGDEELVDYDPGLSRGWDHGGCWVKVEKMKQILDDQHVIINLDEENFKSFRLLSDAQIRTCNRRIGLLRDFLKNCLEKGLCPTSLEMVRAVDFLYDGQLKAMEQKKYDRHPASSIAGRYPPEKIARLNEGDREKVVWGSRSPSPPEGSPQRPFSRVLFPFERDDKEGDLMVFSFGSEDLLLGSEDLLLQSLGRGLDSTERKGGK